MSWTLFCSLLYARAQHLPLSENMGRIVKDFIWWLGAGCPYIYMYHLFISVTVTSSEVKKRLHEFVISKKQKDLAIASLSGAQAFKHWLVKRFLFVEIY